MQPYLLAPSTDFLEEFLVSELWAEAKAALQGTLINIC